MIANVAQNIADHERFIKFILHKITSMLSTEEIEELKPLLEHPMDKKFLQDAIQRSAELRKNAEQKNIQ